MKARESNLLRHLNKFLQTTEPSNIVYSSFIFIDIHCKKKQLIDYFRIKGARVKDIKNMWKILLVNLDFRCFDHGNAFIALNWVDILILCAVLNLITVNI